jgi:Gpi18-like mannosyltransferase
MNPKRERVVLLVGVVAALIARMFFIPVESGDYVKYLDPWYRFMQANGIFHAFEFRFANYSPLYLHLLSLTTPFPIQNLYVIKTWSVLADFLGAGFAYRIVKRSYPQSLRPAACFVAVLFIPTVILNSAAWGQCDMMVCALVLGAVYYLLEQRFHPSFILLGLAFALKPQTMFILPIFGLGWLRKQYPIWFFAYPPLIYLLTIVPSRLAGRHLKDLLLIYFNNATGKYLVAGIPNFFTFIPSGMQHYAFWTVFGLSAAAASIAAAFLAVHLRTGHRQLSDPLVVELVLFSALAAPFFLPQMHDRYYFVADVFSVLYCFLARANILVPLAVLSASLLAYLDYLFALHPISFIYPSTGVFLAVVYLFLDLLRRTGDAGSVSAAPGPAAS